MADDDEWVLARVEQHWAGKVHLMRQRAPKGIPLKVELTDAEFAKMPTALDSALEQNDELTSDLVELEDVTEYTMLHTLRERYQKDLIYTAIGPVLVSINPYKAVDTCSPANIGARGAAGAHVRMHARPRPPQPPAHARARATTTLTARSRADPASQSGCQRWIPMTCPLTSSLWRRRRTRGWWTAARRSRS